MANLNGLELENLALKAGFNHSGESRIAAAIALAESNGNPNAVGPKNSNGTVDYGLWQINSAHTAILAKGNWSNPSDNAGMAYAVYKSQGFKAWTTFNDGAYLKKGGAPMPASDLPTQLKDAVPSAITDIPSAIAAFGTAMNNTIRKIASNSLVMVLALVLLIVGIALLLRKPAIALAGAKVGGRTVNVVGDKAVGSTGEIVDRVIKADAAKPLGKHSAA